MSLNEVRVPDIGEVDAVDVVDVYVRVGDVVTVDQPLIGLESAKSSMDVVSTVAGKIVEVKVAAGGQVGKDQVVVVIEGDGAVANPAAVAAAPAPPAPAPPPVAAAPTPVAAAPAPAPAPAPRVAVETSFDHGAPASSRGLGQSHASPAVRLFARELGVDLSKVQGSGRKQRITKEDVQNYVKSALARPAVAAGGFSMPEMPTIDFAKFGPVSEQPLSRIQKLSASALHRGWLHVPLVTQHDEADITEMEAFRKDSAADAQKRGFKLTPLVFLMKAVVAGLKEYPKFNSSLDPSGEFLVMKHYFHIGIAVDTPKGLVVPVIRDVSQKSLYQLSAELAEVSGRAREGKLKPSDIQGACFTISSLGGIGGTAFTPLVNPPEVAILGVSRSSIKPVWNEREFVPRLMLPLSLSYDHRVIDGADAARFTTFLARMLGDIRRLLL